MGRIVISETSYKWSITVGIDHIQVKTTTDTNSESEDDQIYGMPTVNLINGHNNELTFTLDILKFELVILVNIPPPGPPELGDLSAWIGLCHLPLLDIDLSVSGGHRILTNFLNAAMPVVKDRAKKKLDKTLIKKWVYPNIKHFPVNLSKT